MKTRHTKSFQEKYSGDCLKDCLMFMETNKKLLTEKEIFDNLPYIGICYTPMSSDFGLFWYDGDEPDFVKNGVELAKVKVVQVNEDSVHIFSYDNHNHGVHHCEIETNEYELYGNEIRIKED
jgi:hypothetical protein